MNFPLWKFNYARFFRSFPVAWCQTHLNRTAFLFSCIQGLLPLLSMAKCVKISQKKMFRTHNSFRKKLMPVSMRKNCVRRSMSLFFLITRIFNAMCFSWGKSVGLKSTTTKTKQNFMRKWRLLSCSILNRNKFQNSTIIYQIDNYSKINWHNCHRASQKYHFSIKHTLNLFLFFCLKLQNNSWQQRKKNACECVFDDNSLNASSYRFFFFLQRSQNWWSNALKNAQLQSRSCWILYDFTESKANEDRECLKKLIEFKKFAACDEKTMRTSSIQIKRTYVATTPSNDVFFRECIFRFINLSFFWRNKHMWSSNAT